MKVASHTSEAWTQWLSKQEVIIVEGQDPRYRVHLPYEPVSCVHAGSPPAADFNK